MKQAGTIQMPGNQTGIFCTHCTVTYAAAIRPKGVSICRH